MGLPRKGVPSLNWAGLRTAEAAAALAARSASVSGRILDA